MILVLLGGLIALGVIQAVFFGWGWVLRRENALTTLLAGALTIATFALPLAYWLSTEPPFKPGATSACTGTPVLYSHWRKYGVHASRFNDDSAHGVHIRDANYQAGYACIVRTNQECADALSGFMQAQKDSSSWSPDFYGIEHNRDEAERHCA